MKNIFFIFISFLTINLFAQPPGGGGGRRSQGGNQESSQAKEVQKFSANDVAGIFYYDIDDVIKKVKVKDTDKQYSLKKALRNYNFKVKEISFLNSIKFSDLDVFVNSMSKGKDSESRKEMRKKVEEAIRPVRDSIHEHEKVLNEILEGLLSEKQTKKWLKYQKKMKQSLEPEKPQNNNRAGSNSNGGGRRRQ
ncbi:hypothetical protein [Polaribacter sp.]|uniref:hypothetical protein n=1 Tax=Polaribacter sp. TaxID=1920175 RepID=UPI003EF9D39C